MEALKSIIFQFFEINIANEFSIVKVFCDDEMTSNAQRLRLESGAKFVSCEEKTLMHQQDTQLDQNPIQ